MVYQGPLRSDFSTSSAVLLSDVPGVDQQAASGTLQFPRSVGIGSAFRPAALWTVALDLTWDDWTDAIIETPPTGRISLFDGEPPELSATRDTLSWNAGAERLFRLHHLPRHAVDLLIGGIARSGASIAHTSGATATSATARGQNVRRNNQRKSQHQRTKTQE